MNISLCGMGALKRGPDCIGAFLIEKEPLSIGGEGQGCGGLKS